MEGLEAGRLDVGQLQLPVGSGFGVAVKPLPDPWAKTALLRYSGNVITLTTAGWFRHCNLAGALYDLVDAYLAGDRKRRVS